MWVLHTNKQNNRLSPDYALPEEYLCHILDEHCLEDTRAVWCLTYPSGVSTFRASGATFLGN